MSLWQTSARFAGVGVICAATHNAIVIAGSLVGIHYAAACVISYVVVVVLGFCLHARFTFSQPASVGAFWRYALSMAANYPATLALLFLMCDLGGAPVAVASPVATGLLIAWNFFASRWAIVRKPPATQLPTPSRQA